MADEPPVATAPPEPGPMIVESARSLEQPAKARRRESGSKDRVRRIERDSF
jgi:hypothetical protein